LQSFISILWLKKLLIALNAYQNADLLHIYKKINNFALIKSDYFTILTHLST